MIYLKKEKDKILKYDVNFDEGELEKLRIEIINNCSIITHQEYDATKEPTDCHNHLKIRNYQKREVRLIEYNDFYSSPEMLYHFSYDEYHFPLLAVLLEDLISGQNESVYKILELDFEEEKMFYVEKIKSLFQSIAQMDNSNITEKIDKLNELQKFYDCLNDTIKISTYYSLVKKALRFSLIDSIENKDVVKLFEFMEIDYTEKEKVDKLHPNLTRILKITQTKKQ